MIDSVAETTEEQKKQQEVEISRKENKALLACSFIHPSLDSSTQQMKVFLDSRHGTWSREHMKVRRSEQLKMWEKLEETGEEPLDIPGKGHSLNCGKRLEDSHTNYRTRNTDSQVGFPCTSPQPWHRVWGLFGTSGMGLHVSQIHLQGTWGKLKYLSHIERACDICWKPNVTGIVCLHLLQWKGEV